MQAGTADCLRAASDNIEAIRNAEMKQPSLCFKQLVMGFGECRFILIIRSDWTKLVLGLVTRPVRISRVEGDRKVMSGEEVETRQAWVGGQVGQRPMWPADRLRSILIYYAYRRMSGIPTDTPTLRETICACVSLVPAVLLLLVVRPRPLAILLSGHWQLLLSKFTC